MTIPKVHSDALAHLLETVGQKVEQFTATLDHVSDDIRAVEKWLQASAVRVSVEHVYRTDEDADQAKLKAFLKALDNYRSEPDPVPAWRHIYALAWASESGNKPWRVLHITRRSEGTYTAAPGDHWSEPQVVESRPLIETPAPVRLGIGNALEKLVEAIASMMPDHAYGLETLIEGELNVDDKSWPPNGTGPWRVSFQTGPEIESTTGQRVYRTWNDVLDAVQSLLGPDVSLEGLTDKSISFPERKVPVRVLRELKLM